VSELGGLAIPAHVDRQVNGLFANLGFVPTEVHLEAMEISRRISREQALNIYPQTRNYPLLIGGDAHRLNELLGANELTIEAPTVEEIRRALRGEAGRKIRLYPGAR
jgi:PHP family Zn ribbon phosphoesterase